MLPEQRHLANADVGDPDGVLDAIVPVRRSQRVELQRQRQAAMLLSNEAPAPSLTDPIESRRARRAELQRQRRASVREQQSLQERANSDEAHASQASDADVDLSESRRARKSELQRRRRANLTQSGGCVSEEQMPGIEQPDEAADASERRLARKTELQRRRRNNVQDRETPTGRAERVAAESAERIQRRHQEDHEVQQSRRSNRRATDQARDAGRRAQDANHAEVLSDRILTAQSLTQEDIACMSQGQRFTQDPKLALAYYYCCGVNPGSFVFGNERVHGDTSTPARRRLESLLDDYPKSEDLASCQHAAAAMASEQTSVWACASCGRIVLKREDGAIQFRRLRDLREDLLLSQSEKAKLLDGVSVSFVRKYRQVFFDGEDIYFLIPELVRDRENVPLCEKCNSGPRANKFSVASGHDYGRVDQLPILSDVALACITPTRCFGLELSLSRSTGHAIAFPSSGPCESAKVLPSLEEDCMPRVTFVGPLEDWRLEAKKYRHLYAIDGTSVYQWLNVLSKINTVFLDQNILVDDSVDKHRQLADMEAAIEASVQISQSEVISTVHDQASLDQTDPNDHSGDGERVDVHSSVVLPPTQQSHGGTVHEIVDALIDAVDGHSGKQSREGEPEKKPTVIAVKRARSPFVEWLDNASILAGVFPNLFLTGGSMLPSGPLPRDFVDHFMHYWDGRFEKSVMFSAMLFNQLQRHSAVQKAARVGISHGRAMAKFGKLASTPKFKQALQAAKANPESPDAVRMNATLLRLLALVGGCVPFSPFERAATRPKLGAMRYRYGVAQHFVTIAPPEHDDLLLQRIAQLRETQGWNDLSHPCLQKQCRFEDLPDVIQSSSEARQAVARRYPALSAQVFERQMTTLTRDILRCPETSSSRISRDYLQQQCGVYGRIAAFNAVIEPQSSGRLHTHMTVYGSSINPDVLTRVACSSDLWPAARKWFNAVSTTQISEVTREWSENWKADHGQRRARAFEVVVPDAGVDLEGFLLAAEKRAWITNVHSHSHTCRKGLRGRFVCRLARPAGVHEGITKPLHIRLIQPSNLGKRRRAIFDVKEMDAVVATELDSPHNYSNKQVFRPHADGAVVWEQTRPERDSMFVETNIALACLSGAHTNSAIINGKDAGDMVEEYQQSYMTKEKGGLKCGTAVMLTALNDIENYPSVADDQGSDMRRAKHLATRTVNAFTGGTEWPHVLMAYALAGHRSFQSSDTFWYVFPHKLAEAMHSTALPPSDADNSSPDDSVSESESESESEYESDDDDVDVNQRLASIVATANDDSRDQHSRGSTYDSGGARMFKVEDQIVLVTQAQSYRNRGEWFEPFSAFEFEAVVDILPRCEESDPDEVSRGRPKRRGFDLGQNHPLVPHFQGFIRAKFKTIMLGGPPPPSVPKNGQPSAGLSKYILGLFHPWSSSDGKLPFQPTSKNLLRICRDWNSTEASFINAQRYRIIHNVMQKHYRSSKNEKVCSEWRSRNAEIWNESTLDQPPSTSHEECGPSNCDPEAVGLLSVEDRELYSLAKAAAAKDQRSIDAIQGLRASFWALIPTTSGATAIRNSPAYTVYRDHITSNFQLSSVARSIHAMVPPTASSNNAEISSRGHENDAGCNRDPHQTQGARDTAYEGFSTDQQAVFDSIVSKIEPSGKLGQTLTVLHGGGGTGKSTLIRHITRTLSEYGIDTVSTCPTGVGASHLDSGKTIHSAFKLLRKTELTANDLELMRLTFTEKVGMIVVDEVSMLSAENLALIDSRLRQVYKNNLRFGGRSLILAGDFLQIDVTAGTALCKMTYGRVNSPVVAAARALFRDFKVFFLTQQHRAACCEVQKANLLACRSLPSFYPTGLRYTADEMRDYRPITRAIAQTIATAITTSDIQSDSGWLDEMTILVTNNIDKAALTPCTARLYATRHGELLFRWKRKMKIDLPPELQRLVYDEDAHPELFAYFVKGVRAQILDNNNGNVGWCIANGSPCRLHSLAWEDSAKTDVVLGMVREARHNRAQEVDLPFPPDFINVQLLDPSGAVKSGVNWPEQFNLDTEWVIAPDGKRQHKQSIVIPIGLMGSKTRKKCIHLGKRVLDEAIEIEYIQHAVDIALVMTVWKAQGSTLKRVILNLEPTGRPKWGFEHIYVGLSRVTAAKFLRCLPLTGAFRLSSLQNLRPSIYTTKWRLDNREDR